MAEAELAALHPAALQPAPAAFPLGPAHFAGSAAAITDCPHGQGTVGLEARAGGCVMLVTPM